MLQCSNSSIMEQNLLLAFSALAHPQRLDVVRLLVSQHPVPVPAGAIGAHLGLKPSTLSGYLAQLIEAGLITQERRGTSLLYSIAIDAITALNTAWIGGICRGRGLPELAAPGPRIRNLLFLGHRNTGPSLMAEAVFRTLAGDQYEVFSAGLDAADDPDAEMMARLRAQGYETDLLWSKSVDLFTGVDAPVMDVVITLGATAHRHLPALPGYPINAPWILPQDTAPEELLWLLNARLHALSQIDPATATRAQVQDVLDYHRDTVLETA